ncbi:MAG: serine/threonine-protein kinase [Myxococcota bacterium]
MASLSSHPLPASALQAPALQRIYENTPKTPPAGAVTSSEGAAPSTSGAQRLPEEDSRIRARALGGRYELAGYLDSGGTADVFAAIDRETGSQVAVKVLNAKATSDARLRHYFLQGARGAARVEHANLVRVLAVEEPENAPPYAVMEIVHGDALSTLIQNHGTLPVDSAVELALQAASGLEAAHRAGMIHCDVKPENLLVEAHASERPRLKVIDFDLAAFADEREAHEHPLLRGTAKYMAPEQVVGDGVDARTDVYALGVVLYRTLTGHLPFDLELCPTLLWHQLASPAPPLSWLRDELEPNLEAIVQRALRKAPDNRYTSMADLIADLRSFKSGGPLLARLPLSEPDAYLPRTDAGRAAARAIARCV